MFLNAAMAIKYRKHRMIHDSKNAYKNNKKVFKDDAYKQSTARNPSGKGNKLKSRPCSIYQLNSIETH